VVKDQGYLVDICLIYASISFLAVVVLTRIYTGVYREAKAREAKKEDRHGNS
jgi:multicomponent Na+:H+ antiporter subunit F